MSDYRLGTMGFGYPQWAEVFYPPADETLGLSRILFAVLRCGGAGYDILCNPAGTEREALANGDAGRFRFCAKAPKEVTHDADPDQQAKAMLEFVEVMRGLGKKLAVILLQFPPSFVSSETKSAGETAFALPEPISASPWNSGIRPG